MLVEVELFQVIITEGKPSQSIVLKEKKGDRVIPIFIGFHEAMAIDRKLRDQETPRPLTHDLLVNTIEKMGGHLARVVLNDLKGGTYFAQLIVHRGDEVIEIDARPSDAIALAVRTQAEIFAEEMVIKQAMGAE